MGHPPTAESPATPQVAEQPLVVAQPITTYRAIWPLGMLLLLEVVLLIWLGHTFYASISWVLLGVVLLLLLIGLLPALLRPSVATNLLGCFVVILAGSIWYVPSAIEGLDTLTSLAAALDRRDLRLALFHVALLAPLTIHLALRFPISQPVASGLISGYYLLIGGISLAVFAFPLTLRPLGLVLLWLLVCAGMLWAGFVLFRTIRLPDPSTMRLAQQARMMLLLLLLAEAPLLLLPLRQVIPLTISYEVALGAQIILPLGLVYLLLRHDLFQLDRALRRTLDYAVVSFALLVIYFSLTTLITSVIRGVNGSWGWVATVIGVLIASATFAPLYRVAQQLVDRLFYPERLVFMQALATARLSLAQVVQREAVLNLLEQTLPRQLDASWARCVLRPSFEQPPNATQPGAWSTLLLVGGQTIGSYWLGPRRSGVGYAPDEQEQLDGLLQQAALALAYAQTFDALTQLNQELETQVAYRTDYALAQQRELAAVEERQRLARELHDSVKQVLFSLGLGIRAARSRVQHDPVAAIALLKQQEQAALMAQADMGELLSQLRSPTAEQADLTIALHHQVDWFEQQYGLDIALEAPPALILPAPLPRELTQIVREGLHNVVRHSGSSIATVKVSLVADQLELMIRDSGRGFDPATPVQGYGLRGMQERIQMIGGQLTVTTAPTQGTTLWITLPLKPHPR